MSWGQVCFLGMFSFPCTCLCLLDPGSGLLKEKGHQEASSTLQCRCGWQRCAEQPSPFQLSSRCVLWQMFSREASFSYRANVQDPAGGGGEDCRIMDSYFPEDLDSSCEEHFYLLAL